MLEEAARTDADFARSLLWHSPEAFARAQGYQIVLVRRASADLLRKTYLRGLWSGERPLRTLLWPFKLNGPELKVRVFRHDKDLKLLFETGPSLVDQHVLLRAMRRDAQRPPLFFNLSGPSQIVTVPLDQLAVAGETTTEIYFETDLHYSKSLMPYDDRLLLYRLEDCELVSKDADPYSASLKSILHADWRLSGDSNTTDIVDPRLSPSVNLGVGWYQKEQAKGTPFRWMADHAEIVMDADGMGPRQLKIVGQVGPSAPSGHISVSAELNGFPLADINVANDPHGRATISLDCDTPGSKHAWRKGQNVIQLAVHGGDQLIPGDPRLLNFRVFQITETEKASVRAAIQ
jgi:hypothetical protein